jgi:hypothetical protein
MIAGSSSASTRSRPTSSKRSTTSEEGDRGQNAIQSEIDAVKATIEDAKKMFKDIVTDSKDHRRRQADREERRRRHQGCHPAR